jgi:LmbE family N-acetylglucosaminyl deacetylase
VLEKSGGVLALRPLRLYRPVPHEVLSRITRSAQRLQDHAGRLGPPPTLTPNFGAARPYVGHGPANNSSPTSLDELEGRRSVGRQALASRARAAARRVLEARAQDRTEEVSNRSCVVVAPHPDDETFGCGATIHRKTSAQVSVTIVVVSDGESSHTSGGLGQEELAGIRQQEARRAAAVLGVEDIRFLSQPDGRLADSTKKVSTLLWEVLDALAPEEVITTTIEEPHPDHSAVALAVRDALSRLATRPLLLEFPIWQWSSWPLHVPGSRPQRMLSATSETFRRPVWRVEAGEHLAVKKRALEEYATQLTRYRGDPSWEPLSTEFVARFLRPCELFYPVLDHG